MTSTVNECYAGAVNEQEERFHRLMAILAARSRTELDEIEIEIYDRHLSPYGYEAVCLALESILVERASTDPFPAIGAILARMGMAQTPKAMAIDVTNRIVNAIRSKGYNWSDKVQDFEADQRRLLGELGCTVVKRLGGWQSVIEFVNGNPNHYRTWIRDSATAIIESEGTKVLQLPPSPRHQIDQKS
jgi:hypothetical protein